MKNQCTRAWSHRVIRGKLASNSRRVEIRPFVGVLSPGSWIQCAFPNIIIRDLGTLLGHVSPRNSPFRHPLVVVIGRIWLATQYILTHKPGPPFSMNKPILPPTEETESTKDVFGYAVSIHPGPAGGWGSPPVVFLVHQDVLLVIQRIGVLYATSGVWVVQRRGPTQQRT